MYELLFVAAAAATSFLFILFLVALSTFPKTVKAFDKKLSEFIYGAE